jgi:hypothetical protein
MSMSLFWGLLLAGISGWMLLHKLGCKHFDLEKASYSILAGLGIQSIWMFILDVVSIQFSQSLLTFLNLIFIISLTDIGKVRAYRWQNLLYQWKDRIHQAIVDFNMGKAVIWGVMGGLFYLISVKSLFWPTTEHDAIGTFDKLGIWYAIEGKIHVSLYDVKLQGAGGIYPPLFHCSIAYVYLYGAENPKILSLIYYLCCLFIFYSISKRYITSLGASFFTLLLAWAPEFFSHAALLLSNLPSTAYVAMAVLPLFVWRKENNSQYFTIALIGTYFSIWLRQDLIVFGAVGFLLLLIDIAKLKTSFWCAFAYVLTLCVSFFLWTWYVHSRLQLSAASHFDIQNLLSASKYQMVLGYLWAYLGIGQKGASPPGYFLYGLAFLLPFLLFILSWKHFIYQNWWVIGFTILSLFFYAMLFVMIDETVQDAKLSSLMESSFKRGLFCFMPLVLFWGVLSEKSRQFFEYVENYLWGHEKN